MNIISNRIYPALIGSIIVFAFPIFALANNYICKTVDKNWAWFSDHVAVSTEYGAIGKSGRVYEVGTGISVNDSPWGRRKKHTGESTFKAYGAGAVHIRVGDSGPPFRVCAGAISLTPINILRGRF